MRNRLAVLVVKIDRIHQLTGDIELELICGVVPDTNRFRSAVPIEMIERGFLQVAVIADAVEDIQSPLWVVLPADILQKADEFLGLLCQAKAHEGVHGKGRVADPTVAVIPIPMPPDTL